MAQRRSAFAIWQRSPRRVASLENGIQGHDQLAQDCCDRDLCGFSASLEMAEERLHPGVEAQGCQSRHVET